jgi:hypothetical protein
MKHVYHVQHLEVWMNISKSVDLLNSIAQYVVIHVYMANGYLLYHMLNLPIIHLFFPPLSLSHVRSAMQHERRPYHMKFNSMLPGTGIWDKLLARPPATDEAHPR